MIPKKTLHKVSVQVDVTNPGHFFACCGLLELAHRKWPGAQGWFHRVTPAFELAVGGQKGELGELVDILGMCNISGTDERNVHIGKPFSLLLDWWQTTDDDRLKPLKTWAGQQKPDTIAMAAQHALRTSSIANGSDLFNYNDVLRDPKASGKKKIEPFYFDPRRFASALDTGFSVDTQGLETPAHPAVELLALIGLQRFHPMPSSVSKWNFEYRTWPEPLDAPVAAAVASCSAPIQGSKQYRFSLGFRDNQKRYKSFGFAIQIGDKL